MRLIGEELDRVAFAIKGAHHEYHPTNDDYREMAQAAMDAMAKYACVHASDLVNGMLDAFHDGHADSEGHLPSMKQRMERALRVALDAMDYAMCQAHEHYLSPKVTGVFDHVWLNGFIASVVSRLLHPKPKPAEERVDIRPGEGPAPLLYVDLDGITQYSFASEVDAEIYRLGLIAKLKAESEKSA